MMLAKWPTHSITISSGAHKSARRQNIFGLISLPLPFRGRRSLDIPKTLCHSRRPTTFRWRCSRSTPASLHQPHWRGAANGNNPLCKAHRLEALSFLDLFSDSKRVFPTACRLRTATMYFVEVLPQRGPCHPLVPQRFFGAIARHFAKGYPCERRSPHRLDLS